MVYIEEKQMTKKRDMEWEKCCSKMGTSMMDNGKIIEWMEQVKWFITRISANIADNGLMIRKMEREN